MGLARAAIRAAARGDSKQSDTVRDVLRKTTEELEKMAKAAEREVD
jgi:hypothetical protein